MKPKIILVSLLLLSCSISYSQIVKSIGIKSGITLSNQSWENTQFSYDYNFVTRPGLYEAITLDFIEKEFWQLSLDLGIYQSVSKLEVNPFGGNTMEVHPEFNFKFGFITASPVLKLKIPIKSFTPYLIIAPRIDYFVSDLGNKGDKYFGFDINKPSFGFSIGEGVEYKLNKFSLFVEYQFFYSFNYLYDQPAYYPSYQVINDRMKTNSHIISLGLKYYFKKIE